MKLSTSCHQVQLLHLSCFSGGLGMPCLYVDGPAVARVSGQFDEQQVRRTKPGASDLLLVGESASSEEALEALTKELPCTSKLSFSLLTLQVCHGSMHLERCRQKRFFNKLAITCLTSSSADCENSLTPSRRLLKPCFHIAERQTVKLGNKPRDPAQLCARPS